MKQCRYLLCAAFVGIIILSGGCSRKPVWNPPKIRGDKEAIEIIERMKENGKDLKSFIVEATAYGKRDDGVWEKVVTKKMYAKIPFKVRAEMHCFANSNFGEDEEAFYGTDRNVFWQYRKKKNEMVIWKHPYIFEQFSFFTPENVLFFFYAAMSFTDISQYLDTDIQIKILKKEKIEDRNVYVLELHPTSRYTESWLKLWVDAKDYVPLRIQIHIIRSATGEPQEDIIFRNYKKTEEGIWVFESAEGKHDRFSTIKRTPTFRVTWKDLQINPDIPDSMFKLKTPKGAKVKKGRVWR